MTAIGDAGSRRRLRIMIVALMVAQLVGIMNSTIITTALPAILSDLDGTAVQGTWMMVGSLLGITVTAPIWGRIGDRYDPLVLLRVSLVIIMLSGVVASLAVSPLMVILARVGQSLGLGGQVSLTVIVLARTVTPRERGRYMGWLSAIQLTGTLTGPFFGGLVVDSPLGWRGCFVVVLPVILVALLLLQFSVRLGRVERERPPVDYLGAALLAASISAILVWVSFAPTAFEPSSPLSLVLLGGGVAVLVLALVVEWRAPEPVLPLRVLRGRVLLLCAIGSLGAGMAGFAVSIFMSLYFQLGRGVAPTFAGLLVVSMALGTAIGAFVVGERSARTGRLRRYMLTGGIVLAVAAILLSMIGPSAPLAYIAVVLFVLGLGQGSTTQFFVLAAQNEVGLSELGAVSGFMNFAQLLGGSIMMALFGALLELRLDQLQAEGMSQAEAYSQAVPELFVVCAVAAVVTAVAIALLPSIRLRRSLDLEQQPAAD